MTATTSPADAPVEDEPLAVRDTLPITRRSRGATRLTIGLLVTFGISAGFLVGVLIEKNQGTSSSTAGGAASFAALAQGFAGAAGGGGAARAGGGGGFNGGATTGQIKLIDGTNIYVVDSQGNTVKVSTTPSSTISTAQPSTLSALQIGENVVVRGATGSDGTVTATSITATGTPTPTSP